jgi:hypothetical protein
MIENFVVRKAIALFQDLSLDVMKHKKVPSLIFPSASPREKSKKKNIGCLSLRDVPDFI